MTRWNTSRRLRRNCASMLNDLNLPDPFDLERFCQQLAQRRGRPLRLVPVLTHGGSNGGYWIRTRIDDVVIYESGTTAAHSLHIALHEIGHLLFDHHGRPQTGGRPWAVLFRHLDPAVVQRVLGRSDYEEDEEREAETFACVAGERIGLGAAPPTLPPVHTDPDLALHLVRLTSILQPPESSR